MAVSGKDGYLRRRWPLLIVAVTLVLAVSWQVWYAQRLIGKLRTELAVSQTDRSELAARLAVREQQVREVEAEMAVLVLAYDHRAELATRLLAKEQRVRELEAAMRDRPPVPARPGAWSAEGLAYQPHMTGFAFHAQGFGFTPGTTRWRPSGLVVPAPFTRPRSTWSSPGALVAGLVSSLNLGEPLGQDAWELTTRVFMPEAGQASAIIMMWGLKDDSVVGRDYLLVLRQHQGNWYVAEVQERFHCSRGVVDNVCL